MAIHSFKPHDDRCDLCTLSLGIFLEDPWNLVNTRTRKSYISAGLIIFPYFSPSIFTYYKGFLFQIFECISTFHHEKMIYFTRKCNTWSVTWFPHCSYPKLILYLSGTFPTSSHSKRESEGFLGFRCLGELQEILGKGRKDNKKRPSLLLSTCKRDPSRLDDWDLKYIEGSVAFKILISFLFPTLYKI